MGLSALLYNYTSTLVHSETIGDMVQLFLIGEYAETIKQHWIACGLQVNKTSLSIKTYLQNRKKLYCVSFGTSTFVYSLPDHVLVEFENDSILEILLNKWDKKRDQNYEGYATETCSVAFKIIQINKECFLEISGEFKKCPPMLLAKIIPFYTREISNVLVKNHLFKDNKIDLNLKTSLCLWMHAIFEYDIQ